MARVDFYHLQKSSLEDALPQLLTRALGAGARVVVVAASEDRVEDLNTLLWSDRDGWLPHGSARDGHAADQPVWLTDIPTDNPNDATLLILTEGMDSPLVATLPRTLDLFNGRDEAAVAAARARWKARREAGHTLHYWQQTDEGRWVEKARQGGEDGDGAAAG
ncbi:DNA polymerase III subunit chi [Novispirillum sp. DQ9]|uniref:DNA polymerase III subunit chi n=1 Tax=Novispirillum sp. DQ9 TaxID=3398612 RepID=UPI003C7BC252